MNKVKYNPPSKTISVVIHQSPNTVYQYVRNGFNLPLWAKSFCKSVEKGEGLWYVDTYNGRRQIRFVEDNPLGVLDHYVLRQGQKETYVPMRVLEVENGSELQFTLFHHEGISDEEFAAQERMVIADLSSLREILDRS